MHIVQAPEPDHLAALEAQEKRLKPLADAIGLKYDASNTQQLSALAVLADQVAAQQKAANSFTLAPGETVLQHAERLAADLRAKQRAQSADAAGDEAVRRMMVRRGKAAPQPGDL